MTLPSIWIIFFHCLGAFQKSPEGVGLGQKGGEAFTFHPLEYLEIRFKRNLCKEIQKNYGCIPQCASFHPRSRPPMGNGMEQSCYLVLGNLAHFGDAHLLFQLFRPERPGRTLRRLGNRSLRSSFDPPG